MKSYLLLPLAPRPARLFQSALVLSLVILLGGCSDNNESTDDGSTKQDSKPSVRPDGNTGIDQQISPDLCGPAPTCSGSQKACPDPVCLACVELGSDEHCSDCNDRCNVAHGFVCKDGECECDSGLTDCLGVCVDTSEDEDNCGKCGNECDVSAGLYCVAGTCTCTGGTCSDAGVDASPDDLAVDLVPDAVDDLPVDSSADISADLEDDSNGDSEPTE